MPPFFPMTWVRCSDPCDSMGRGAGAIVLGGLLYALRAPSVLTLDGFDPVGNPRCRFKRIVRGWTGRGGMRAYLFVSSRHLLGGIVILSSHYDMVELERLIEATGRPVNGNFTERA